MRNPPGDTLRAMLKKLLYWTIAVATVLQLLALLLGQSFLPGKPF